MIKCFHRTKSQFTEEKERESVLSKKATEAFDKLGYKIEEILRYDQLKKRIE